MNFRATTRAAEGLPRRAFTVEEVERMVEVGLIDVKALVTHVHRSPTVDGYAQVTIFGPDALVTPLMVPKFTLRLGSLNLGP